jgi:glycosyltransferase involved in cell wall biosynthesis
MYIVGFNRNRDSYQVPAALAEGDHLGKFVTDYYVSERGGLPTLGHRRSGLVPSDRTANVVGAVALQAGWKVSRRLGMNWPLPETAVDRMIEMRIAKEAVRHPDWNLLIYSSFAREAFRSSSRGRRTLFQFHPFPTFIHQKMEEDAQLVGGWTPAHKSIPEVQHYDALLARHGEEVQAAELIVCASEITRRSLRESGLASAPIVVVPYGCPTPGTVSSERHPGPTRFIFVGSGGPRKGLHHLLSAWRDLAPADATLDLVLATNELDIPSLPRLTVHSKLDGGALGGLMDRADVLLLPSLLEGFGLVLTEALAYGCHLVGSRNTGLPDLRLPHSLGTVIEEATPDCIALAMGKADALVQSVADLRRLALDAAEQRSWHTYRSQLRTALGVSS